jgi:SdrD B-like domain
MRTWKSRAAIAAVPIVTMVTWAGPFHRANGAVSVPVGHVNVSTATTSTFVVGFQESVVELGTTNGSTPRSLGAVSVRYAHDTKATGPGSCRGTDVTAFSIVCSAGLADPAVLEGSDNVVSFDIGKDGTGSVGGVAVIPASTSPSRATLIASAPTVRPFAKGGSSGPNAIITTDLKGQRVSTQYVPGVVFGPACATGWGDGSATTFRGSTCDTPLDRVGETYTALPPTTAWNEIAVGIGDVELSPDGRKLLATNVHDGFLYSGAVGTDGALTKVPTRPAFASSANWRPFGLSTYNDSTLVTWSELNPTNNLLLSSIAVASFDDPSGTWTTVMEPSSGAMAADALSFGVMSAAEVDTAGNLAVTFLDLRRQTTSTVFQDAISAPVIVLPADGVDHWTNNIAASSRLISHAVDGVPAPSFGRLNRDARWGQTVVTTIDTLKYYSGGLSWYGSDGSRFGREQLTWRGEGTGGYRSSNRTVDSDQYRNDTDLLVKRTGNADSQPWIDTYAFGKSNGLGDLEAIANVALIGNRTWADVDGNGLQDAGEYGIAGVVVALLDGEGKAIIDPATKLAAVVATDAGGNWLAAVDADVKVQARLADANWEAGGVFGPGGTHDGWKITKQHAGAVGIDSDADPTTRVLLGAGGRSFVVGAVNYSYDAGFIPPTATSGPLSIVDTVFNDVNRDGKHDSNEGPAPGVTVSLFGSNCTSPVKDAAGRPVPNAMSNLSGGYAFAGLASGDYCIVAAVPPGYRTTTSAKMIVRAGASKPAGSIGLTSSEKPCAKVTLEVLRTDLTWADANDVASAAPAPRVGPNRTYRGEVSNCGSVALSNVIVMPGVVGARPLSAPLLAPGATLKIDQFEGQSPQSIATATATGVDSVSGLLVAATDPAYVAYPTPLVLPATGGEPMLTVALASLIAALGLALVVVASARRPTSGRRRVR